MFENHRTSSGTRSTKAVRRGALVWASFLALWLLPRGLKADPPDYCYVQPLTGWRCTYSACGVTNGINYAVVEGICCNVDPSPDLGPYCYSVGTTTVFDGCCSLPLSA